VVQQRIVLDVLKPLGLVLEEEEEPADSTAASAVFVADLVTGLVAHFRPGALSRWALATPRTRGPLRSTER
jgi:hypothetical protein